jgi:hypothetical protein
MSSRKMVGLDEAHFMEGWRSGRSFLVRLARDSRKWNLAALVASQNPKDILGLDVQNLVSTVFVGRIAEDQEIASEALRLLRVPVHDGYEATLASLSQVDASSSNRLGFREFVMRDVDGRVQKVRVDVSYVDGLLDHLDTTPAVAQAAPTVAAAAASAVATAQASPAGTGGPGGVTFDRPVSGRISGAQCDASTDPNMPGVVGFGFPTRDVTTAALAFSIGPIPGAAGAAIGADKNPPYTGPGTYSNIGMGGKTPDGRPIAGVGTVVVNSDEQTGTFALSDNSASGTWDCGRKIQRPAG